jgi:hypothetical protein
VRSQRDARIAGTRFEERISKWIENRLAGVVLTAAFANGKRKQTAQDVKRLKGICSGANVSLPGVPLKKA